MDKKGFTLLELVIVVAIMTTGATVGFLSLGRYSAKRNLDSTLNGVAAMLRDTQKRAMTQQGGSAWGVRFTNGAGNADVYQVFASSSYVTSTIKETGYLRNNVVFSEPFSGTSTDISFLQVSGKVNYKKIISIKDRCISSIPDFSPEFLCSEL